MCQINMLHTVNYTMFPVNYISKKKKTFSVNTMSLLNVYSMIFIYLTALHLEGIFVMDFYILCVGHFFVYYLEEYLC